MKKILNKNLSIKIFVPLVLGTIIGMLIDTNMYSTLNKPFLSPPGILFPIVWSILYILMGISNYLTNNNYFIYKVQLIVNLIWPIIFFNFKLYFISFAWIIILIYLVIKMLFQFFKDNKKAAYLNVPYLIWLLFAAYLNFGIYLLN